MNLTIIEGGKAADSASTEKELKMPISHVQEAELLRKALLKLVLPEIGLTVIECHTEICARLEDEDIESYFRGSFLCHSLEHVGINFQLVDPSLGLARPGFLKLVSPKQLLLVHPELSQLHPEKHLYITFG